MILEVKAFLHFALMICQRIIYCYGATDKLLEVHAPSMHPKVKKVSTLPS